jgi:hypothetical protein
MHGGENRKDGCSPTCILYIFESGVEWSWYFKVLLFLHITDKVWLKKCGLNNDALSFLSLAPLILTMNSHISKSTSISHTS